MPEMTPREAEEMCDSIADGYEFDQQEESDYHDEWISKLRYAASLCRKIASGEYAPVVHIMPRKISPQAPKAMFEIVCPKCGSMGFASDEYCAMCGAILNGEDDSHE